MGIFVGCSVGCDMGNEVSAKGGWTDDLIAMSMDPAELTSYVVGSSISKIIIQSEHRHKATMQPLKNKFVEGV
jgi:hypothetical protein